MSAGVVPGGERKLQLITSELRRVHNFIRGRQAVKEHTIGFVILAKCALHVTWKNNKHLWNLTPNDC